MHGRGKMAQCFVFITDLLLVLSVFNCLYCSTTAETTSYERIDCAGTLFWKHLSRNLDVFNTQSLVGVVRPVVPPVSAEIYACRDGRLLFNDSSYRPKPPRTRPGVVVLLLLLSAGIEQNPGPGPDSQLRFGVLNVRSAVNKAAHIHDVIADLRLDVLVLTETWITSDSPDAVKLDVAPPDYSVVHRARGSSADKRGGGIALVHRDSIKVRQLDFGVYTAFEALTVKLTLHRTPLLVSCIYRPPGAVTRVFCDSLADLLDELVLTGHRFVVCGDVNCPGALHGTLDNNLVDVLDRYSLQQHVRLPTHVGGNLLDVIATSDSDTGLVSHISTLSVSFSDHSIVSCRLNSSWTAPTTISYQFRHLRRVDRRALSDDVVASPLYIFTPTTRVDDYVHLFQCEMQRLVDLHAPLQTRCRRVGKNECRWLSDEARAAERRCRRLERRYRRTQAAGDRQAFAAARSIARDAVLRSRSDDIQQRFADAAGDHAATWRVTHDVLHRRQRTSYTDDESARLATDFSAFFSDKLARTRQAISVGLQATRGFMFPRTSYSGPTLDEFLFVTVDEARKAIISTAVKSSPLDILPSRLLRDCADVFAPIMGHMANLSFTQGTFPEAFKMAQVLPLLKKPGMDKDELANYRPISNLPTVSKVLERLALNRLRPQMLESPLYNELQSAYRKCHSTETALLHMLNGVYSAVDSKHAALLVALDISAAFDTIRHSLLLTRLETDYGVHSTVLSWLHSYLTGRQQFVKLGRHSSTTSPCIAGVPQGSVLGPLLFTAYVAPIGRVIKSFNIGYHQFVDDTQLFIAVDTSDTSASLCRMTDCSNAVQRWFLENDLLLNGNKSETVMIGTTAQLKSVDAAATTVSIAGASLPVSRELKSLGVILDDHLRFDRHASAVAKACAYHTRALRHVRHLLTTELATTIACSIVATRLDYCNSLLYGAPEATLDKLQRAQNNLARVVTCSARRSSAKPLLESLHWLPVRQRCIYKLATLTYKVQSTTTPAYLNSFLIPRVPACSLRSGSAPRLVVPRTRTIIGSRAFSVAAPTVWNSLPDNVVNADTLTVFKKQLKSHLFTAF